MSTPLDMTAGPRCFPPRPDDSPRPAYPPAKAIERVMEGNAMRWLESLNLRIVPVPELGGFFVLPGQASQHTT
jgi:hypothetical protein